MRSEREQLTGITGPLVAALAAGALLFAPTLVGLVRQWWSDPDAGHGLLLAPVALWLAWRSGIDRDATPRPWLGLALLGAAVLFRYAGALAAELFAQRMALLLAAAGLVTFFVGPKQLYRWWLPVGLLVLAVPLPKVLLNALALPLQFQASRMGAALLEWRGVPVLLSGNIIQMPGHQLFVTEACSGLRSLTALLSLGLLLGGLWLRTPWLRAVLLAAALVVAIGVNGLRVFLTGFLVLFVSPRAGEGFMHLSEGWALFVISFLVLGVLTWALGRLESLLRREPAHA